MTLPPVGVPGLARCNELGIRLNKHDLRQHRIEVWRQLNGQWVLAFYAHGQAMDCLKAWQKSGESLRAGDLLRHYRGEELVAQREVP